MPTLIVAEWVTVTVAVEKSVVRCRGSGKRAVSSTASTARRGAFLRAMNSWRKGLVDGKVGEVARAAQLERSAEAGLEMPVRGLDRAVLVANAGVVAGRLHAVVAAELGVARRLVLPAREIAVGRREPVGANVRAARRQAAKALPEDSR